MPSERCSDESAPTQERWLAGIGDSPEVSSASRGHPPGAPFDESPSKPGPSSEAAPGGIGASLRGLPHCGSLLHAVFETVPMAIAVVGVPGYEVLLANRRLDEALSAATPGTSVVGRRLPDVIPCEAGSQVAALLQRVADAGEAANVVDLPLGHSSQGTTYWRLSISPVLGEGGTVVALVIAGEETTARVAARQETAELAARLRATNDQLTQANVRLQAIIGRLPQGIIVVDREGRVTQANRAAERLLGRSLPIGAKLYSLEVGRFRPDGKPYDVDDLPLPRSLRGETCYGVEIEVHQPGGQVVHTLCSSAPLYDAAGFVVAAVSIFQDITELRELDRLKDEFLSIASHELKNPLTVLKGYVQILLRGDIDRSSERERHVLATIDREVNRLGRLINVMLDVSRIQLGGLKLDRQQVDLAALARKLVDNYQGVTPRHHIALEVEIAEAGAGATGHWDAVRIEQVLANLIDNAVKYSPNGGRITVRVRAAGGRVEVAVRDEGVGIAPEDQAQVFQKFYRAAANHSGSVSGLGLGLYVCHEIIRAHGGSMWLESAPGQGSTFYFSLPAG